MPWIVVTGAIILLAGLGVAAWVAGRWLKSFSHYLYRKIGQYVPRLAYRRQAVFIAAGFASSALMLALFFAVAEETFLYREMDFADSIIIWLVRCFARPGLDTVMIAITNIGSVRFYGLFMPIILAGLAFFQRWREAASLAICLGGAAGLNYLLKNLFERARPDLFRVVEETGYSFPSGHAMVALCFYGMIVYLAGRSIASRCQRFGLYFLAAILVIAIGISRIYLGVHYPSDVLGGYVAGAMWLSFCIAALAWYGL